MSVKTTQYPVIKVRLYPSAEQATLMEKTFGCCRYLWNQMLSDVQEFYAATDIHYIPTPAKYKKSAPFLTEIDSQALCTVHQNLRKAFLAFFRAPQRFGYPQFKRKKSEKDSFTVYCRPYRTGPSIRLTDSGIQMPKLGVLKAILHREPQPDWHLTYVTITRSKSGKYFASIVFRTETEAPAPVNPIPEKTLGLNHSLSHFYTDSEGNMVDVPRQMVQSAEKLARMQQKLSRMRRGSRNYEKQRQKIRLIHEHLSNQRKDFAHQQSRRTANAWDAVCVRETDLIKLSQRVKGVNVMESGFGLFRHCLKYKLERQGKQYIEIDPYAPTAKSCHNCGFVNEDLSRRDKVWYCPSCGAEIHREVNAARNIRDWGLQQIRNQTQETGAPRAVS